MRYNRLSRQTGLATILGVALLSGASATTGATAPAPGVCLEADASSLAAVSWREVHEAIVAAAAEEPAFFFEPVIVARPDLAQALVLGDTPTVKIGIWTAGQEDPTSDEDRRDRLTASDCLTEDAGWSATISHELLVAGAERILAAARLPDESGEPPIRDDAEAAIHVEFQPAEGRVRTTLEFSVPVGPFEVGGSCWIDDVLSIDVETGTAISTATDGNDVPWVVESACGKYKAFMTEGGAGEQALTLLPTAVPLSNGTTARFVASSVEVRDDAIVTSGAIDHD